MTVQEKKEVTRVILKRMSRSGDEVPTGPCVHQDIFNFVEYCDNWLIANQASFGGDIPQPAKGWFGQKWKAGFLAAVMDKSYQVQS